MSALPAVLSGTGVGFTLGLIGGGGSILATPLLLYAVGLAQPHLAIGTGALAVAANAFMTLAGHARAGNVRWRCAAVFALVGSSVPWPAPVLARRWMDSACCSCSPF